MSLRVGGFPEYSPKQQKIFDIVKGIITRNYADYGFQHIRTPAVESNEVLMKGGEETTKQIFGLYGMAQGADDLKNYSLHFDLTVPFARYVLDWQNEIVFPFKRYQIQPVWRGERSQKGRFKEFWQADIDAIWRGNDLKMNAFYDAEIISCLANTLSLLRKKFGIKEKFFIALNDKNFIVPLVEHLYETPSYTKTSFEKKLFVDKVLTVLDNRYKIGDEQMFEKLKELGVTNEGITYLKNSSFDQDWSFYEKFNKDFPLMAGLCALRKNIGDVDGIEFYFDASIVRGLDYYTGTVFETFIEGKRELGSICSGGSYANFTDFLDKKNSFSGVGGSIGLSRLMSILFDELEIDFSSLLFDDNDKMACVYFPETIDEIQGLAREYRKNGRIVDIFPSHASYLDQLKNFEKRGYRFVLVLGENERNQGVYKIRNLETRADELIEYKR